MQATIEVIGECACGRPATMEYQELLSPTKRTPLVKICQACLQAKLDATLNLAIAQARERARIRRSN